MPLRLLPALVMLCLMAVPGEACVASYYGSESGNRTASGELFHPDDAKHPTCAVPSFRAARTKPYYVRVINLANHRSIVCRVNDRGPADRLHRCIDLSRAGAKLLDMIGAGTTRVSIVAWPVSG